MEDIKKQMEDIRSIIFFKKQEEEKQNKDKDLIALLEADLAYKTRNPDDVVLEKLCLREQQSFALTAETMIKEIKIFIASQSILMEDRDFIENLIRVKNDDFIKKNIYLKPIRWELADKGFGIGRKQDEFNEMLLDSEIVIYLTCSTIGHYTNEEFKKGYESMKKGEKPFRMYFFNKKSHQEIDDIPTKDIINIISYREIKDLLRNEEKIMIDYEEKYILEREIKNLFDEINKNPYNFFHNSL